MKLRRESDGLIRKPPAPDSPTVTVYFGGDDDSRDVGVVRVDVPAGAGMPPHKHHGSDVVLSPITGFVRIAKGDEAIDVHVGDAALVTKDEAVSLTNPGTEPARLLVAAGPADFVGNVRAWPDPTND